MIAHSRPWLVEEDETGLGTVAASGWLVGGPQLETLKQDLGRLAPGRHARVFASGRAALAAALDGLNLPPASQVIVQAYVCDAVVWAIRAAGLEPVFCDIGDGWLCRPQDVEAVRTPRTGAVILAPPFGLIQPAAPFADLGLPLIHDLCQSSPGVLAEPEADLGDLAVLSFHPTKYAGAAGGGAVLGSPAHDARLAAREAAWAGFAPFTDLQALLASNQIARLSRAHARRADLAYTFAQAMPEAWTAGIGSQDPGALFRFALHIDGLDFDAVRTGCEAGGVAVRRGVDALAPGASAEDFPGAARALASTLSIPFYPALSDAEAVQVAKTVLAALGQ